MIYTDSAPEILSFVNVAPEHGEESMDNLLKVYYLKNTIQMFLCLSRQARLSVAHLSSQIPLNRET